MMGAVLRGPALRFTLLVLAQLLVFAADVVIDAPVVLTGVTSVPVLVMALLGGPRATFALGAIAVVLILLGGAVDGTFLEASNVVRAATVTAVCVLAGFASQARMRLEEDVARLALLAAVGDARPGDGPQSAAGVLLEALAPSYADLARVTLVETATTGTTRTVVERGRSPDDPGPTLVLPLSAAGRHVGTLELVRGGRRARFGRADQRFGRALAARAALVIENARLVGQLTAAEAEQRHVAQALQHSLRPPEVPDIPGAQVGAYYRAVGAATQVGGDFYDAYPLQDGWLLVIGDVTGKGAAAASVTALARGALEAAATQTGSALEAVARLDALLGRREELSLCSVALVHLRLCDARRRAEVLLAGHPPVLLLRDGAVRPVGHPGSLPGAFPDPRWRVEEVELREGDALVLRTDGVTDAVGADGRLGEERLHAALEGLRPASADAVLDRVRAAIDGHTVGTQRDDTAVVAVVVGPGPAATPPRPRPLGPDDLQLVLDGTPSSVAAARRAVEAHLGPRLTDAELADVRLLVSELASNAVRHGGRGPTELTLGCDTRAVRAIVVDPGSGFLPPDRDLDAPVEEPTEGGYGLALVARLASRWGVDRDGGTRVWFELDR